MNAANLCLALSKHYSAQMKNEAKFSPRNFMRLNTKYTTMEKYGVDPHAETEAAILPD